MFAIQTGQPTVEGGGTGLTAEEIIDLIASTLVAGTGITIVYDDAANTITISAIGGGLDAEAINDLIGASIVAGSGISVVFDDAANTITITNTAPHVPGLTVEDVQDVAGAMVVAGTGISVVYNDAANTLTITNLAPDTGVPPTPEDVRDLIGATLVAGQAISITIDDAADTITIAVPNNAITYSILQDVSQTQRILARKSAGPGDVEESTISEVLDFLGIPVHGDIVFRGAAGWQKLPPDTTGKVLTTKDSGFDPVWATPSLFAFRNRIMNGNFLVDQIAENGNYIINAAGKQTIDGWSAAAVGTGIFNVHRNINAATGYSAAGLQATVTTAQASMGAGDAFYVYESIEGFDIADFHFGFSRAETVTLSFIIQSSVAGIYGVTIHNQAFDRTYATSITINNANTPEFKTLSLPGDIAGAWPNINGAGLTVVICLACGTASQSGAPNTWQAGNFLSIAGQANFMNTIGNILILMDVQLEKGNLATPFERTPFQQQLARAQRYYEKSFNQGIQVAQAAASGGSANYVVQVPGTTGQFVANPSFAVEKRITPTIAFYSPVIAGIKWLNATLGVASGTAFLLNSGSRSFSVINVQIATDALSHAIFLHWTADARLS